MRLLCPFAFASSADEAVEGPGAEGTVSDDETVRLVGDCTVDEEAAFPPFGAVSFSFPLLPAFASIAPAMGPEGPALVRKDERLLSGGGAGAAA